MSLNRYEQLLHDYIERLPEEKRFWGDRVVEVAKGNTRRETAALILNQELWEYFEERSRHEPEFERFFEVGGSKLVMLNLSEYMLRMWAPVKVAKKSVRGN